MVTRILFFFIVSAKHHAQWSDPAGERVLVLLRILGSEVLEIFFSNARRGSEPNQRAFLVCGDLRCPLTLEGANRIDFGVTLECTRFGIPRSKQLRECRCSITTIPECRSRSWKATSAAG